MGRYEVIGTLTFPNEDELRRATSVLGDHNMGFHLAYCDPAEAVQPPEGITFLCDYPPGATWMGFSDTEACLQAVPVLMSSAILFTLRMIATEIDTESRPGYSYMEIDEIVFGRDD